MADGIEFLFFSFLLQHWMCNLLKVSFKITSCLVLYCYPKHQYRSILATYCLPHHARNNPHAILFYMTFCIHSDELLCHIYQILRPFFSVGFWQFWLPCCTVSVFLGQLLLSLSHIVCCLNFIPLPSLQKEVNHICYHNKARNVYGFININIWHIFQLHQFIVSSLVLQLYP